MLVWLSCLTGVVSSSLLAPPDADRERISPDLLTGRWRLAWASALALVPILLVVIVAAARGQDWLWAWWFARNHLLLFGIGALASLVLPPVTAWLPGGFCAMLCWFVGTRDAIGTPWPWALVHYPPESTPIAVVALVVAISAVGAQGYWPARSDH